MVYNKEPSKQEESVTNDYQVCLSNTSIINKKDTQNHSLNCRSIIFY